jgi:predicted nucleotidyltransferase
MCVVVSFLEAGFVHVSMGVLGSVLVGVGVLVLDVLVVVRGVRVRVSNPAVLVLVRMRPFMGVLFGHRQSSPLCETYCAAWL